MARLPSHASLHEYNLQPPRSPPSSVTDGSVQVIPGIPLGSKDGTERFARGLSQTDTLAFFCLVLLVKTVGYVDANAAGARAAGTAEELDSLRHFLRLTESPEGLTGNHAG